MGTTPIRVLRDVLAGKRVTYKTPARAKAKGAGSANWPVVHATVGYHYEGGRRDCRAWLLDYHRRQAAGASDPLGIDSREVGGYHAAYASSLVVALLEAERRHDREIVDELVAALRRRLALYALLSVPHRGTSVVLMPACRAAGYLTGGKVIPPVAADRDWMLQLAAGLPTRSYAPLTWRAASKRGMESRLGVALFAERFGQSPGQLGLPLRAWAQGQPRDDAVEAANQLGVSTLWPIRLRHWPDGTYAAHIVGPFSCLDDPRPVAVSRSGEISATLPASTHPRGRWWPRGLCEARPGTGGLEVILTGASGTRAQAVEQRIPVTLPRTPPVVDLTIDLAGVRHTREATTPPAPAPPSPGPPSPGNVLAALRQALGREIERRLNEEWTLERIAAWLPDRFKALHDRPERTAEERAMIVLLVQDAGRVLRTWRDRDAIRTWSRVHFERPVDGRDLG